MDSRLILCPHFLLSLLVCRSLTQPSPPVCQMIRVLAGCDVAFLLYSKCEVDKVLKSVMLSEPSPLLTSPPSRIFKHCLFFVPLLLPYYLKHFWKPKDSVFLHLLTHLPSILATSCFHCFTFHLDTPFKSKRLLVQKIYK